MKIEPVSDSHSGLKEGPGHHHAQALAADKRVGPVPCVQASSPAGPGACPKCGMALERNPAYVKTVGTVYTCPMHPEVRQDHPGACPICGMALEPVQAAPEEDDTELRDILLRFKIGLVLGLPVIVLAMGAHFPPIDAIPAKLSAWIQFIFSTPGLVFWCGWPFFERGVAHL